MDRQEAVEAEVRAQQKLFDRQLTALMQMHAGKWVVFLDGVQGVYDTETAASRAALQKFGLDRGPVIAKVERTEPVLLHAAFVFNLGH